MIDESMCTFHDADPYTFYDITARDRTVREDHATVLYTNRYNFVHRSCTTPLFTKKKKNDWYVLGYKSIFGGLYNLSSERTFGLCACRMTIEPSPISRFPLLAIQSFKRQQIDNTATIGKQYFDYCLPCRIHVSTPKLLYYCLSLTKRSQWGMRKIMCTDFGRAVTRFLFGQNIVARVVQLYNDKWSQSPSYLPATMMIS